MLVMEVGKVADEVTDMEVDKVADMKIPIEDLTEVILVYCENESSSASLIVCNKICDCMCTEQQAETCFLPINSENICHLRRSGKRKTHHQYCRVLHELYSIAWYCMAGYQKVIPHFLVPCCMLYGKFHSVSFFILER